MKAEISIPNTNDFAADKFENDGCSSFTFQELQSCLITTNLKDKTLFLIKNEMERLDALIFWNSEILEHYM